MSARRLALALAVLVAALLPAAQASADPFAYRDAGCTLPADPAHLRLVGLRVQVPGPLGGAPLVLTGAAAARAVVDRLAFHQPLDAASSQQWFRLPDGACVGQTTWVTNHSAAVGGSHVRFWQSGGAWQEVWGAAHHEFLCVGLPQLVGHQVDDLVGARDAAAAPFRFLNTTGQGTVFAFAWKRLRPAGFLLKGCGGSDPRPVFDDGLALEIRQLVPVVAVP